MSVPRKNIIFIYFIFLFIVFISGCSQNDPKGINTTVKGSFPAFKGKSVTLSEIDINKAITLDTSEISEDGSFSFRFRRQCPGFYLIKVDNKNYITLVLDEEKRVEISSDLPNLRKEYEVKGSPDSELYRDFEMFLEANRKKVDSLSKSYTDYQRSAGFQTKKMELDKSYQEIFKYQRQYAISFLENHCGSLASLLVINRRFGERKVLTEKEDLRYFMLIDSCLSIKYPDNKHLVEQKKRLEMAREEQKKYEMIEKRLAIGQKVPDISLQNLSGNAVPLYSLLGKPVVLYFWASWDQQSRKANITMKELINKAGKVKPAVYAIGLESYKEPWEDAIRMDGLQKWTNVTDYLNIYSSAKSLFNIPEDLPYFILLDKEMMIRYRGNNFKALASEIDQLSQ
ncbi:MAG: AhpC/TSA family protein [Bacteroidales bacterium]|nr:AhpC/TSA family protein [Bacteroidales bacterium]